jgi:UDP-2-acetamido-3-amino-2,3-dideoxy-glucuronate N-acetyltransferase
MPSHFVHASAVVDPGAQIGDGTKIWHFCHISAGARIGRGCSLGQNVFVGERVTIGDGVRIQNNVSVYEGVTIEDSVFIGPSVVFTNVKTPRAAFPRRGEGGFAASRVQRGASIGANATIVCGVTIAAQALVGAGAVVTRDVAAHALVVGVPARAVGWACECGARLAFELHAAECKECGRRYRLADDGLSVGRVA